MTADSKGMAMAGAWLTRFGDRGDRHRGRGRLAVVHGATVLLAVVVGISACAGDVADDGGGVTPSPSAAAPTPDAAAEGDLAAFCTLTAQFDRQDGPPTNEQLAEVKRVRPDEVGADVDLVADAFLGADGDLGGVMGDPDVAASMQAIDDWTASNCPDVEVVASPVDPAFAEYCAASVALEEGIPTADQLRELLDLAPDAIAGPADAVGELLDAEGGNVGAVLADPDGKAAIEEIMAWEAANCGGGSDGPEDDGDVEPAAGAEVIPVVGG